MKFLERLRAKNSYETITISKKELWRQKVDWLILGAAIMFCVMMSWYIAVGMQPCDASERCMFYLNQCLQNQKLNQFGTPSWIEPLNMTNITSP